jgi:hypothetical protein
MTDLELLDTAVRIVKRDGPWFAIHAPHFAPRTKFGILGTIWYFNDGVGARADTVAAINRAYLNLRPL